MSLATQPEHESFVLDARHDSITVSLRDVAEVPSVCCILFKQKIRDPVECSTYRVTGDSMASKGQFVGLGWNRIARLHSQVMTGTYETH